MLLTTRPSLNVLRVGFTRSTRSAVSPSRSWWRSRPYSSMAEPESTPAPPSDETTKLHGRAFYESIGAPKYVLAPMVDQSEFAWRMLSRSFIPPSKQSQLVAYTPMFHARLFAETDKYQQVQFKPAHPTTGEPYLDGNPALDRPLFVQFCANDPEHLLAAAKKVAPYCDAVDLNLGCPQGIARKGHYGAFLQEDQNLVFRLINILHKELSIPVTAKIRILETPEKTLQYAQNVLKAGASILTVHGRRREQKGHLTGLADWEMIKFLRDSLPPETVMFANGNVLEHGDIEECLKATGADGIMSAEGNLSDPAIFAPPPQPDEHPREFWQGMEGRSGWRVDAVMRRYMDILHRYVEGRDPPTRQPLFIPGDDTAWMTASDASDEEPPAKKRRTENTDGATSGSAKKPKPDVGANYSAIQPHLFHMLRHFVSKHTDVRDMLARTRKAGLEGYEKVLAAVELKVAEGLLEFERTGGESFREELDGLRQSGKESEQVPEEESSLGTIRKCKRPWWVVQPIVRPLPKEAMAKGAIQLSRKEIKKLQDTEAKVDGHEKALTKEEPVEAKEKAEDLTARDELVAG